MSAHLPFKETVIGSSSSSSGSKSQSFDPAVHLAYQEPTDRLSMSEMGLDHVSAPVSLRWTLEINL